MQFMLPLERADSGDPDGIAAGRAKGCFAGGRPRCPLCNRVLEEDGRCIACPGSNGHAKERPIPPVGGDA
jgi:hypothetical protein